MKNRKLLLRCLTLLLAIVILTANAAAAPGKIFSDVPDNHWAERYIARMSLMGIIEGYEDGSFGINQPVSRFEIVTAIIRVMGLESQAEGMTIPASFRYPASVPGWAEGYVAMGVSRGIISGDDLVSFRGGEPAKRYEVAVFIGKALGFAENEDIYTGNDFLYIDQEGIPEDARGYAAFLKTNGLMEGNEMGAFRPLENVTRGEMAVLMAKLGEKLGKHPDREIRGTVSQVTPSTITVKTPESYETLIVNESSYIFLKDGKGTLSDIAVSDPVLAVKSGFRALLLDLNAGSEPLSQGFTGRVSGTVLSISYLPQLEITLSTPRGTQTFPVSDDCSIERDGEAVLIKDILAGDKGELVLEEGQAAEISAEAAEGMAEGRIKEIMIRDKALLTIVDTEEEEHTYEINSNTRIRKDGGTVTLLELKAGDLVDLQWESGAALKIYAESRIAKDQITGKVIKVNTDLSLLTLQPDGADSEEKVTVFAVESTKLVTLDGVVSSRLNRVRPGDRVVIVGDLAEHYITAQTIIILGPGD